ncbi:hypothetical protein BDN70DRAFT_863714 [Pholiota conissans]|uniref:F-box domain-containing protein n=1 Tax=Pholiota conissans TaxID=109636 RepID=A0A9P5YUS6_9AGAR|nr:hypothetical protein BDN70DRAFT_863714 [Pholiota conissans]
MKPLPPELWILIAEQLPPDDLLKLIGVNRLFFNLIMNELYGQLSFITADPHVFLENDDLIMCERVRVLTMWPSAVRDAVKAVDHEKNKIEQGPERPQSPLSKPLPYLHKIGGMFKHTRSLSRPNITPPSAREQLPSPEDRLDMFLSVIRKLKNVDEFEINWYLDHGPRASAWHVSFFPEIWSSIGHNLRRLSIDIQVFKLNDVIKSCGSMPNMEELQLTLRCDSARPHPGDTVVPYFLNKFSPTLRALSIKTIGHQPLSTNFLLLDYFPRLTKLSLIMPLDAKHLSDPSGLEQLLRNHPNLQDLCLRYSRCCIEPLEDGFKTLQGRHQIYSGIQLPGLRALELGLHLPVPRGTDPMLDSIARLGKDLTSLTLVDRSLTLDEVKVLLRLFPSYHLRRLSLFARFLTPQLIDVIAHSCPDLNSLALDVQAVVRSETEVGNSSVHDNIDDFTQALFNYAVDLDNGRWRYRVWTLADISVMKWEFKVGHTYSWPCMKAIAYVVPSIRSFAGQGHMREDNILPMPGTQRRLLDIGSRPKPFDT